MNHTTTQRAQIGLAYLYACGFLIVLLTLILTARTLDEFTKSVLLTMLGYLGALVQQQSSYFFARQRPETSQPGETTIKTTPSTTIITKPAESQVVSKEAKDE